MHHVFVNFYFCNEYIYCVFLRLNFRHWTILFGSWSTQFWRVHVWSLLCVHVTYKLICLIYESQTCIKWVNWRSWNRAWRTTGLCATAICKHDLHWLSGLGPACQPQLLHCVQLFLWPQHGQQRREPGQCRLRFACTDALCPRSRFSPTWARPLFFNHTTFKTILYLNIYSYQ